MQEAYRKIASLLIAIANCEKSGNDEWADRHRDTIDELCENNLPSGSGFDSGTALDYGRSTPDRLVFLAPFHRMSEHGYYDGWIDVKVTIKASLASGPYVDRVTGIRERRDPGLRDYVAEVFNGVA